jgi:DNA-binding Lrp family transcriptional regulator
LLIQLQKNARLSNAELAELVGMSTTACWNRTRQLENEGYIRGYVALLDQQKLGFADIVLLEVTLDRHDADALARFGAELTTPSEVLDAYLVSGDQSHEAMAASSAAHAMLSNSHLLTRTFMLTLRHLSRDCSRDSNGAE